MKTTIDLPTDLLRSIDQEKMGLSELIISLLRSHLRQISKNPRAQTVRDEPLEWRQELL